LIADVVPTEFLATLPSKVAGFPTNDDLTGAVEALLRLQDTYALTSEQIARGDLMGAYDSPQLTGDNCVH
jgi:prolyl 4-hydroxylase